MTVAVFCGSSSGNSVDFVNATKELGKYFAQNGIDIVYGGGKVGLMGTIADSLIQNGGKVYGVIPEYLKDKELAHETVTKLEVVPGMHERKALMAEKADAFVALPGGAGTLEEIFEVWTWAQLGFHTKPCAFFNINGFYDKLFEMLENMCEKEFMKEEYFKKLIKTDNKEELLKAMQNYTPPKKKWD